MKFHLGNGGVLPVRQVTVRNMPAASQTPTVPIVPADTLDCLQDCLSVYMYTRRLPLPSQYCYTFAPAKLITAVL
jgi:hypothetical protein